MSVDDSGMIVSDTGTYTIGSDTPIANAGSDTSIFMGNSILLHGTNTQTYGHIVKWEWKISNNSFVVCSTSDTLITPPDQYSSGYQCILKVTDDNGATDLDTISITVGKEWELVGGSAVSQSGSNAYSLDIDYTGTPYLAYIDTVDTALGHVFVKKFNGTSWEDIGTGTASGARAENVDLAIGSGYGYGGIQYGVYYLAFKQRYTPLGKVSVITLK